MTPPHKSKSAFWAPALGSRMFEGFCRMFFKYYSPLKVEGCHHLPKEPFLLCSNHCSHADSAALMTASGRSFRTFALIGASDYFFRSRRVRWSVSPLMNIIPIDRQPHPKALAASIATCREFLDRTGGAVILYPEGTRSPDGEMRGFKAGAGLFAIELGVPVVPAYVGGTHHILPKGHSMPLRGHVSVCFGAPVDLSNFHSAREALRDRRHHAVEKLAESIRLLNPEYHPEEVVVGAREKE